MEAKKKLLRKANVKMDPHSKEVMEKGAVHAKKPADDKTSKAVDMLMKMKKIPFGRK